MDPWEHLMMFSSELGYQKLVLSFSVSTTNHAHLLLNFSFFCRSYSIISASDKCLMPKVSPQVFPVDLDVGLESLAET